MVNQIFYRWQHRWIYDFDELAHAASLAGFDRAAVYERRVHEGLVPEVASLDMPKRDDETLYVELIRT
jgi:hypothetical protein